MDSKRLAIAFALSAAILILWTVLFPPPKAAKPAAPALPTAIAKMAGSATAPTGAPASPTRPPAVREEVTKSAEPAVRVPPIVAETPKDLVVSGPLYTARLSNRGGELVSFALRRFQGAKVEHLDLVRHGKQFPGRTLLLDPLDPFLARAATALYASDFERTSTETTVRFRYREADGNEIRRTYKFGIGYPLSLTVERTPAGAGPVSILLGPSIGNPSAEELENRYTKPGSSVTLSSGGGVTRKPNDLKEPADLGKGLLAAGLEDNYFLTAFLPGADTSVTLRPLALVGEPKTPGGVGEPQPETLVVLTGSGSLSTGLYLGPKDIDILDKVRPGMEKLIDYGWFAILVKPLLLGLKWIQSFAGNWGVSIILITILIKILLFPLTYKQLVSMKKMSVLQPKVEAIRLKWATKIKQDPQARLKMNEEMMAIYKQEGVNPAGGCLPLVLQMPILIAFYNLLAHAIELRHAPFALWITDLSAKDAYYVTPILMTLTMWLQQQMMPATGDPTQRRVMAFLPLVFGFMFKDMPSGLVLYWLVQNVLGIAQQLLLERYTDLGARPKAKKA